MVCLGAVIRGGTPHYDYICAEVTKGIGQVQLAADIPVVYGVITPDTIEQAIRSGRLPAGTRLPTHRDFAKRLGVAVSTVSRAYGEATERGLIGGAVGRGTFVLANGAAVDPGADRVGIDDHEAVAAICRVDGQRSDPRHLERGIELADLAVHRPSLEEIYLSLTDSATGGAVLT